MTGECTRKMHARKAKGIKIKQKQKSDSILSIQQFWMNHSLQSER
jgi:hypothetical protein